MNMPPVKQSYYPFSGGLDLLTPAIALREGVCIDAQNYEPEISGGYRRIDGNERYDGKLSPTSANYWTMTATITGTLTIGQTVTGLTSAATGRVLNVVGTAIVLGRVIGLFQIGEVLQVGGISQATTTTLAALNGSDVASDDAANSLLAANDIRQDILVVPGSGPIRGVWIYKDVVYAFRDNAGATLGQMWKASSAGWVQVTFGTELQFSSTTGGAIEFLPGQVIGNAAAPTKTATIIAVLKRAGTMGTDAVGSLVITPTVGVFSNADPIFVGITQKAVATSAATAIFRNPGGRVETLNYNFTSSTNTQKMYGCDGVNLAFEFDGINYIPIRTGMATDTPTHLIAHRFYLFLSFRGSVQFSGITNPYSWTAITGAGELALGDDVTGFLPQGGSSAGSSMAVFTRSQTSILYGSSSANWNLVTSVYDLGYSAYTFQPVSNNTYGLTARGIQCLLTTLTYGDFDYASISHEVMPFIVAHRGLETASNSLRTKDQYRVYYSDGSCLALGLTGDKINGIMPLNYNKVVRCIVTQTLTTGTEVTYFGSDDGYIYQDNIGTSQDGAPIQAWIRLPFNHLKSPQIRKRYRSAVLELRASGFCMVTAGYELGYGNPSILLPAVIPDQVLTGGGGYWDQFTWDQFTWDAKSVENPYISINGTEKNISFLFYTNSAAFKSHTLQGITLMYTPQRISRGS